ncbi:MAG: Ig-like domain-containing domain [Chitinophagales bacterium]
MNTKTRLGIWITTMLLLAGCANIVAPTGGKRDTKPPELKSATPPNKTLFFNAKTIKLHFSEFIQPGINPQEVLISPPLDLPPQIYAEGKSVTIHLKGALKPNTTYTLNFGDAIKDNNEGNIFKNFTYVFSTGGQLDSAKIGGLVVDALTQKEVENVIVALYPADSVRQNIRTSRPYYFAQTEKDGTFKIENIKPGYYRAFGLVDQNLNYIFDQPNEQVAFQDQPIKITDSANSPIALTIFEMKSMMPHISEMTPIKPGKIRMAFSGPINSFKLDADVLDSLDRAYLNASRDTVTYWYANRIAKRSLIVTTVNDTLVDSTRLDLISVPKDSIEKSKNYLLSIENQEYIKTSDTSKPAETVKQSPFKPVELELSLPLRGISSFKSALITEDSTHQTLVPQISFNPEKPTFLKVSFPQKENTAYTISLPDSVLTDYTNRPNPYLVYHYHTEPAENYGTILLSVKFQHPEKYYIFKILDASGGTVETFYYTGNKERKLTLPNVHAGTYKLQAIEDENKNGEWDSGNIDLYRQPERIINFKETYELKGKWELEIEVKL